MNAFILKVLMVGVAFSMTQGGVALGAGDKPGKGVTVRPIEGANLEEKFQHQILYRALEELGYEVSDPTEIGYQIMHLAIGAGDGDFTAVHWDPLHSSFFDEAGGDAVMSKVGNYIDGALQGYLVDIDSYNAGITNLGDLEEPEIAARFDSDGDGLADLAGCLPGWGCERVIEHQLSEYDLRDTITHNQGAYATIIADTVARHTDGKPVIYYTWTPFWVSGVLIPGEDVQWLEVPYSSLPGGRSDNTIFEGKDLGFAVNSLRVVANNEFLANNPAAAKLFEVAAIDINDISIQNKRMQDGEDSLEDIARHVDDWIEGHRELFESWLAAARGAS